MANIVIDIAAEFTGKGAFKKAENSSDNLVKSVKSLAKTLGVAFSVQQVLAFGKASVMAAAQDEKAQKQLALALKNVGLGRDVAASEAFISKLQSEFGVVDDKLRPAYQTLAIATLDSAEAQRLLQIALDISAATGKDLATTSGAISKAFLGNNTALGKLGVGISKADLKAGKFDDIMNKLATTFKGAAAESANTFQGSMDKLAVASDNVKEIIGKGIIDSLKLLAEDGSADDLATGMQNVATYTANTILGVASLLKELKKIPAAINIPGLKFLFKFTPISIFNSRGKKIADEAAAAAEAAAKKQAALDAAAAKAAAAKAKLAKVLTAEELKQLKAKQLKAAIDKANLALGKASDVFDMEAIQNAAAEKNAVEQLSKATSTAQALQITNDLARLQVKKDINDLEDAIAKKDVAAITAATNKLNADMLVLGALTNQKVKLTEIDDVLKAMLPKDLINIANLDAAIAKLLVISKTVVTPKIVLTPDGSPDGSPKVVKPLTPAEELDILKRGGFLPITPYGSGGANGGSGNGGNYASSGFPGSAMGYGGTSGYGGTTVNVTVQGSVIAQQDLVQVVQNAVQDNNRYGNNLQYAGAI